MGTHGINSIRLVNRGKKDILTGVEPSPAGTKKTYTFEEVYEKLTAPTNSLVLAKAMEIKEQYDTDWIVAIDQIATPRQKQNLLKFLKYLRRDDDFDSILLAARRDAREQDGTVQYVTCYLEVKPRIPTSYIDPGYFNVYHVASQDNSTKTGCSLLVKPDSIEICNIFSTKDVETLLGRLVLLFESGILDGRLVEPKRLA